MTLPSPAEVRCRPSARKPCTLQCAVDCQHASQLADNRKDVVVLRGVQWQTACTRACSSRSIAGACACCCTWKHVASTRLKAAMETQAVAPPGCGRPLEAPHASSSAPAGPSRQALTNSGLVCGASTWSQAARSVQGSGLQLRLANEQRGMQLRQEGCSKSARMTLRGCAQDG
jgi:hypothetical protein